MAGAREHFRDAYGFEVKKEYQELHTKYTPLWDKEEAERGQRWAGFLHTFVGSAPEDARAGSEEGEAALEAALRQLQASGARREDFPWWQQLRILVQAGLPMALRGRLWRTFLQADGLREAGVYEALVCQALAPQYQNSRKLSDPMPRVGSYSGAGAMEEGAQQQRQGSAAPVHPADRSRSIAGQAAPMYQGGAQDWTVQIEKDLHRTFPGHPVMDRSGRRSLRRILAAYACRNPAVGYCQGMNFVAGCLLLFMAEEDAFWCLCAIVERLLAGYFSEAMVAPQVDQLVLKSLADAHFPRLSAHLERLSVNVASVSTQWFLCLFVNSLPLETCLRVWDLVFFERCASVLFRVALALVDIYAQALVATVDAVDAFSLLQNMAPLSFDSSRLVDVACIAYAHVDAACLADARARHEAAVSAQVQERMDRKTQLRRARLAAEAAAAGGEGGEGRPDCLSATARSLPRIQVCSPHSTEPFCWDPADAQLHLDSSKAAATAYKIASSPAVDPGTGRRGAAPPAPRANGRAQAPASEIEPDEPPRAAALDAKLMDEVADVLDRRREELLREGGEAERKAAVAQLMALVARLEGEMFQIEARRFEAENKAASVQMEVDLLRDRIAAAEASTAERRAELAALRERQASEARDVDAGGRRCLQYSNSLRGAEANRALRASLLSEKQELIDGLQQELGQAPPKPGARLLQKLGLGGRK